VWYRGRVVLIGDAAHAGPPHMGEGGCMAMEDSVSGLPLQGRQRRVCTRGVHPKAQTSSRLGPGAESRRGAGLCLAARDAQRCVARARRPDVSRPLSTAYSGAVAGSLHRLCRI
jgi:hypothetical protein